LLNVEAVWWRVDAFTLYQVVTGEMPVRGRVLSNLNDPEPYVTLRNLSTAPALLGAPRLERIGEGVISKLQVGALRTHDPEPPPPDQAIEMGRRFIFFQGTHFNVKGQVQFPSASDPKLHREMLFKSRFFPVLEATLTVVGVEVAPLEWPLAYLNRDLMVGLYLG
jgi:hypothetical protein